MWLFCGGMIRSGSTLQYQLASSIVERAHAGQRIGWVASGEVKGTIKCNNGTGIHVLKSHIPTPSIITMSKNKESKSLYIYRDLRDVVVSTMGQHKQPFAKVWESGAIAEAIAWGAIWESLPGVLTQRYEAIVENMRVAIGQMCNHVGLELTLIDQIDIANGHSIKRQRTRIANIPTPGAWDKMELLHRNHIGTLSGVSGQWRSALNTSQIKMIEARYGDWLLRHGYHLSGE